MDYKTTLNLPQTEFAMKANLSKREPQILSQWQKLGLYALTRQKSKKRPKYILHDGPPYANGDIHIGHALNKTLKDIVVRFKIMNGMDSPFIPGWDCHGLPVEHQLFKELEKQGINKANIGVLDFRKQAYDFASSYVLIQKEQFKRLGVLGDWDNPYLTINREYEVEILKALRQLLNKGFIYRGLKPINWCVSCETALAEAEVEYRERSSDSIYVKFKLIEPEKKFADLEARPTFMLVWTTTPWTLLANVAVALHPEFEYALVEYKGQYIVLLQDMVNKLLPEIGIKDYKIKKTFPGRSLDSLTYEHPFGLRKGKVILAGYVSKEEGTGCVHTAPGHGQDDYLSGQRYKLETIMPVDSKGRFFGKESGPFEGLEVFGANQVIVDRLNQKGLLVQAGRIQHSYPHCWRCKSPLIVRATKQWFMKIDDSLRTRLLKSVQEDITWVPESGRFRIYAMIETRPDWCLSRQRFWGVPIPAVFCEGCAEPVLDTRVIDNFIDFVSREGTDCWFSRQINEFLPKGFCCPNCKAEKFKKGQEILDVWFDSGVSYQAVLKTREGFFPADLYLEGSDQHRGWFQSSLIPSMAIEKRAPYKNVLTHGFVVDGEGRKMSKSIGNVISPQDVISDYGADVLRLWVASSNYNEDIRISNQILERLTEAYRKIRNTFRFMLGNLYDFDPQTDYVDFNQLLELDRWALSKLAGLFKDSLQFYERFEFYKVVQRAYYFCTIDMSSIYLDILKDRLYTFKSSSLYRRSSQTALYEILNVLLKMLAPILVFTCEEVFRYLPRKGADKDLSSVHLSEWPQQVLIGKWQDQDLDARYEDLFSIRDLVMKALEAERIRGKLGSSLEAEILLETDNHQRYNFLSKFLDNLAAIFIVSGVKLKESDSVKKEATIPEDFSDLKVCVLSAEGAKCNRCWNYSTSVGEDGNFPDICARCIDNLST